MKRCVQVVQNYPRKQCGKPAKPRNLIVDMPLCDEHFEYVQRTMMHLIGAKTYEKPTVRCRYCLGGYCHDEDVQLIELRTGSSRGWDGGKTRAGKKCREYLRGHWRYVRDEDARRPERRIGKV